MDTNAWYIRYMTLRTIVDETVVSYEVATTDTITVSTHFYTSKLTHFFSTSNFLCFFSFSIVCTTSRIGHCVNTPEPRRLFNTQNHQERRYLKNPQNGDLQIEDSQATGLVFESCEYDSSSNPFQAISLEQRCWRRRVYCLQATFQSNRQGLTSLWA